MKLAPDEETRKAIKFWLDCLQIVTVIVAIVTAFITFHSYTSDQQARAVEQKDRAMAQEQQAKEQLATAKRELERPYEANIFPQFFPSEMWQRLPWLCHLSSLDCQRQSHRN